MANFCASCGNGLVAGSGFCSSCGAPVAAVSAQPVAPMQQSVQYAPAMAKTKTKTAAVLLAVFLNCWTWLYTFKRDKVKFFIGLGLGFISSVISTVSYLTNVGVQQQSFSCYYSALVNYTDSSFCEIYKTDYTGAYIGSAIGFGIWLWAVIDTARKKQDYFTNYPNGR